MQQNWATTQRGYLPSNFTINFEKKLEENYSSWNTMVRRQELRYGENKALHNLIQWKYYMMKKSGLWSLEFHQSRFWQKYCTVCGAFIIQYFYKNQMCFLMKIQLLLTIFKCDACETTQKSKAEYYHKRYYLLYKVLIHI